LDTSKNKSSVLNALNVVYTDTRPFGPPHLSPFVQVVVHWVSASTAASTSKIWI
jgi:hypothetical protein